MLTQDQKNNLKEELRRKLQIASFCIHTMIGNLKKMDENIRHLAKGLSEDIERYSEPEVLKSENTG